MFPYWYPLLINAFSISFVLFNTEINIGFIIVPKLPIVSILPFDFIDFINELSSSFKIGTIQSAIDTIVPIFSISTLNNFNGLHNHFTDSEI